MLVWALAATEVVSALSRKRREQKLDARADRTAQRRLKKLEAAWNEVVQLDGVRSRARELLGTHDLRAADALHLAAALLAREQTGAAFEFVTFDRRLSAAMYPNSPGDASFRQAGAETRQAGPSGRAYP
jgi:predicted nucleic acid-binding protein